MDSPARRPGYGRSSGCDTGLLKETWQLLAELGFDVNAVRRIFALHQAASTGDLVMATLLLSLGADPSLKDRSFDSTPLGWAEHGNHRQIITLLTPVTAPDPG